MDVTVDKFLFLSETIAPDKEKHVINLYFKVKKDENSKAEMILGDETNLNDLRFVSKDEIENINISKYNITNKTIII